MNIQGYGHVFSRNPLNRGETERRNESLITEMADNSSSLYLIIKDLNLLVDINHSSLVWLKKEELDKLNIQSHPIFLGIKNDIYHFAISVTDVEIHNYLNMGNTSYKFVDIRTCGENLSAEDAGISAQARIQILWHLKHMYCGVCGGKTIIKRGGQSRHCIDCQTDHFPRTDPVIIVVVHNGDKCLLGQSQGRLRSTNTYSALAGFVDQGESIEEAVSREVMEEAGIKIKNVTYHSSQPWPLPYSIMIGCHAEAITTKINMDHEEMTDVKWFTRNEVLRALEGQNDSLKVPMKIAIAHHLIKDWALNNI
jgi:NAD+ diphosphatase